MAGPPAPLVVPWHAGSVRVRHDDPALKPYSPRASVLLAAMTLASTPGASLHPLDPLRTPGGRVRPRREVGGLAVYLAVTELHQDDPAPGRTIGIRHQPI